MGHAHVENLSTFFIRRLYAKGKLSMSDCIDAMIEAGEEVHASEGRYSERYMISMAMSDILEYMLCEHQPLKTPVLEPVELTEEQERVLEQWKKGDIENWEPGDSEDGCGGEYGVFDSIVWRYAPGWRKLYPAIPILEHVTH